jgi:ribosome-binding protein aMBF1 (putative translation factor)
MKVERVFRANRKSPAQRAEERAIREKFQREKPTLADLIASGDCDPDSVMTMGQYFEIRQALLALKQERQQVGLSLTQVAKRSGLDRAVVSRLENGKLNNPTVATLMRYAAAVGKRLVWSYHDGIQADGPGRERSGSPRSAKATRKTHRSS